MATRKNTAPAVAQSVDASPDIQRTIAEAIAEQQARAWRLAETLRALGEDRDDEGVRPHAVLLCAEVAEQIANALDAVNLSRAAATDAPDFDRGAQS